MNDPKSKQLSASGLRPAAPPPKSGGVTMGGEANKDLEKLYSKSNVPTRSRQEIATPARSDPNWSAKHAERVRGNPVMTAVALIGGLSAGAGAFFELAVATPLDYAMLMPLFGILCAVAMRVLNVGSILVGLMAFGLVGGLSWPLARTVITFSNDTRIGNLVPTDPFDLGELATDQEREKAFVGNAGGYPFGMTSRELEYYLLFKPQFAEIKRAGERFGYAPGPFCDDVIGESLRVGKLSGLPDGTGPFLTELRLRLDDRLSTARVLHRIWVDPAFWTSAIMGAFIAGLTGGLYGILKTRQEANL